LDFGWVKSHDYIVRRERGSLEILCPCQLLGSTPAELSEGVVSEGGSKRQVQGARFGAIMSTWNEEVGGREGGRASPSLSA
jgi:hypothetical protein